MSTRSVVGYERENGTVEGTYVHWDGYPEHMIPALTKRFEEIGFEGMKNWIDKGVEGQGFSSVLDEKPYDDGNEAWLQPIDAQEYGYEVTSDGVKLVYSQYPDGDTRAESGNVVPYAY